ncbi:MAG: OmpA family protein [Desulfobacteraceae bacterium]|nr:OmpA family protein [Desulfobacteraceae bacterium]
MFNRNVLKAALVILSLTLIFSCAQKGPNMSLPSASYPLDGSQYASKVDNFLVIFDTSSSMGENYNGNKKIDIAKRIVEDMNITLPEMGQTAGFRTLGHSQQVSKRETELFYGMEKYSSATFAGGLKKVIESGGTTPLFKAINSAADDFEDLSGNHNALIIISDGVENGGSSEEKTRLLKEKYGTSLCIYTVLVGDAPEGETLMKKLATIGDCGFLVKADQLRNANGMKDFVQKVFLTKKVAPAPEPIKDSDNDGVLDDKDKCPGTPNGAHVNAVGCWVIEQVLFDSDKANIKPEASPFLDEVVLILNKESGLNITLQGHTDNRGAAQYNMGLSLRRVNAVKEYLVKKGISAARIETKGFGLTKPVASNDTVSGRAANRRVEIHPK